MSFCGIYIYPLALQRKKKIKTKVLLKKVVFWDVPLYPEDGGDTFLENVG
jgi:hypothetical protein